MTVLGFVPKMWAEGSTLGPKEWVFSLASFLCCEGFLFMEKNGKKAPPWPLVCFLFLLEPLEALRKPKVQGQVHPSQRQYPMARHDPSSGGCPYTFLSESSSFCPVLTHPPPHPPTCLSDSHSVGSDSADPSTAWSKSHLSLPKEATSTSKRIAILGPPSLAF